MTANQAPGESLAVAVPMCTIGRSRTVLATGHEVYGTIAGTIYELEKLRCNLCLGVFTAEAPAGVDNEKCDATSVSMMALLKYGSGTPFHRLERLQEKLEIPLPACPMVSEPQR